MIQSQYNDTLGSHYVDLRDRLYWNKYQYRATVHVPHGSRITGSISLTLDKFLARMEYYRMSAETRRMVNNDPTLYERWWRWTHSVPANVDFMLRSEGRKTSVYCNDLQYLQELAKYYPDSYVLSRAVVVKRETGVRYFRRPPKHQYRIYLRGLAVQQQQFCSFMNFLDQHERHMKLSPGLQRASARNRGYTRSWLSSSYFIDYDDLKLEHVLELAWGDLLGKRYELKQWDNTVDA